MQIKTPCCKLYLQQGAEKQIEQLSVSFIRTIPSAPESHRISGCINSRSRACGNAIYRRWGIAPRPETDFLALSIAQVLQIARGCAIIDKNKFGDWVGNADAVPQPSERCLSRKAGIVRCCLRKWRLQWK